ncbi:hypothetical protein BD560DRAFT_492179 [Blakeslea trispora]|nr:hypothetical protein BD560DRAFT_492179 [Blakeslea trispora]
MSRTFYGGNCRLKKCSALSVDFLSSGYSALFFFPLQISYQRAKTPNKDIKSCQTQILWKLKSFSRTCTALLLWSDTTGNLDKISSINQRRPETERLMDLESFSQACNQAPKQSAKEKVVAPIKTEKSCKGRRNFGRSKKGEPAKVELPNN